MRIEIVVFDGMDELDAVVPFEVLTNASHFQKDWDVALVGVREPGVVVGSHGMRLDVTETLGSPDAVVVPGGGWGDRAPKGAWQLATDENLREHLRVIAKDAEWVASVCTGAMLLAAAGITKDRPATTHHVAHEDLRASGADLKAEYRVVDDGDLLTCGGVMSGMDLSLWIVERDLGPEVAARVSQEMEYERQGRLWRAV
jgi:transcriptional regulator GlxA family with amidase domain